LKGEVAETGMVMRRGNYFRFGLVFIKKNYQIKKKIWKKLLKRVQTDRFRFGSDFFYKNLFKPVGSVFSVWLGFRFGSVFSVWLGFFGLARFSFWLSFFGLARFSQFGSVFFRFGSGFFPVFFCLGSVRFFSFRLIKSKPNQTGRCF
jgi:hypothetical protein